MKSFSAIFVAVVIALLGLASAEAAVYRWVDKSGKVHFSDKPIDSNSSEVDIRKSNSVKGIDANRRRDQQRLLQIYDEDRRTEKAYQNKQAKKGAELCLMAKERVEFYSKPGAFFKRGPDGERIFYSDEKTKGLKDTWSKRVDQYCP